MTRLGQFARSRLVCVEHQGDGAAGEVPEADGRGADGPARFIATLMPASVEFEEFFRRYGVAELHAAQCGWS